MSIILLVYSVYLAYSVISVYLEVYLFYSVFSAYALFLVYSICIWFIIQGYKFRGSFFESEEKTTLAVFNG